MIKDSDAHMFVDILNKRKEIDPNFYYAHKLDEENRLHNVFWCIFCVGGLTCCLGTYYLSTPSVRLIDTTWCLLHYRHQPLSLTNLVQCHVDLG